MRAASLSEQALQEHIVKLLAAFGRPDICYFAVPNGELRNWKVGVRLKAAGLRAGAADLILLVDGRAHAVELKTEIGTLSAKQRDFREAWERAGGFFHCAFGIDQALGVLCGIKAFRANIQFSEKAGVLQPAIEGVGPGQSTLAAEISASPAASGRGQPSTHAAEGLRVRKGSASGRASRSPNSAKPIPANHKANAAPG